MLLFVLGGIVLGLPAVASAKMLVNTPMLDAGSGTLGVSRLAYKPKRLNLPSRAPSTTDNLTYMTSIRWTRWGRTSAHGKGTLHVAEFPLTDPIIYTAYRHVTIRLSRARRSGCSDTAGQGPHAFEKAVATVPAFQPPTVRFGRLRRC